MASEAPPPPPSPPPPFDDTEKTFEEKQDALGAQTKVGG
jgi:hypothetical protein